MTCEILNAARVSAPCEVCGVSPLWVHWIGKTFYCTRHCPIHKTQDALPERTVETVSGEQANIFEENK